MTPEQLLALVAARSVPMAEPVGGAAPEWTLVDCGYAAAGLTREQMAAFWWRYARDVGVYNLLWRSLYGEAVGLQRREGWAKRVDGRCYLAELVTLVIAEEQLSDVDRQRLRDKLPLRWPEGVWEAKLARRYAKLGAVLDRWCGEAHRHMARRMRKDEEEGDE